MKLDNIIVKFLDLYTDGKPIITKNKIRSKNISIVTSNNNSIINIEILKVNHVEKSHYFVTPSIQKEISNFLGIDDKLIIRYCVIMWFKQHYNILDEKDLKIFVNRERYKLRVESKIKEASQVSPW